MSLRAAAAHRNLLYLLALKELRTRYKKSVLGWAWSLLNPVSQMIIYSVIFLYVFVSEPPTGDPSGLKAFPFYFLSGALAFNFFSISVGVSIGSVQGGAGLIKKVQFPHEHLVFSVIAAQFVTVLIEYAVLATVMLFFGHSIVLWIPPLVVILLLLAIFTAGLALALSAANVFLHDVGYLWTIASQILFFSTPIIYNPATVNHAAVRWIANYGPTGSFITAIHNVVYDGRLPGAGRMLELMVLSLVVFALGATIFNRLSPRFAEEM